MRPKFSNCSENVMSRKLAESVGAELHNPIAEPGSCQRQGNEALRGRSQAPFCTHLQIRPATDGQITQRFCCAQGALSFCKIICTVSTCKVVRKQTYPSALARHAPSLVCAQVWEGKWEISVV